MFFIQILFSLFTLLNIVSCYIMGIDMGTSSMKISLVQSGKPLQIVTNAESKRKTPTVIGFYKKERLFGSNAMAILPRKPELVYVNPYRLVGRTPNHELITELNTKMYYPYEVYIDDNGLTQIKEAGQVNVSYTPEELTAMILLHAKEQTETFGEVSIKDCVITIPTSFTQHEREGVYAAAAIAGLNVLSLIEENTAAALQYAIDHTKTNDVKYVLFYNVGATQTQATIARYSSYTMKETRTTNKTINQLEIVGKGFDTHLGGFHIDIKIAELLADRFNIVWNKAKPKGDIKNIKNNIKIMSKLRQESNKLKEVLSVNSEYPVKIDQLYDDITLNTKVTRKDLENICDEDNIFERSIVPIKNALNNAGLTLNDIDSVELLGGGFRVPKIRKKIEEYFKTSPKTIITPAITATDEDNVTTIIEPEKQTTTVLELGQHLNADESMTLGAAFRGANLSTSFRVRKIGVVDTLNYGVMVKLQEQLPINNDNDEDNNNNINNNNNNNNNLWKKQAVIFQPKTSLLVKPRTVAFNYSKDITCQIHADTDNENNIIQFNKNNELNEGGDSLFTSYSIDGISQFAKDMVEKGHLTQVEPPEVNEGEPIPLQPRVHLTFTLDAQSGIVFLSKAEATLEIPKPIVNEIETDNNSTTNNNDEENKENEENKDNENNTTTTSDDKDNNKDNTTDDSTSSASSSTKSNKKDKKKKSEKEETTTIIRRTLKIIEHRDVIQPPIYSSKQITDSRAKLQALDDADNARKLRESTLNDLETEIYKVRNSFRDNDAEALKKVAKDDTMDNVIQYCNELEDWLYEDGSKEDTPAFRAKKIELNNLVSPIYKRLSELTALPAAIKKATNTIQDLRNKISEWEFKLPHILPNETEHILTEITKYENWLEDRQLIHNALSPYGDDDEDNEEINNDQVIDSGLDVQSTITKTDKKRFDSKEIAPKLKPVITLFKKYNSKPLPKPEKVSVVNSTNETDSENNNTNTESNNTDTENKENNENKDNDENQPKDL